MATSAFRSGRQRRRSARAYEEASGSSARARLARFLDWLADEAEQGRRLSDRTIANVAIPIRAALATAEREGLIRTTRHLHLQLDADEPEVCVRRAIVRERIEPPKSRHGRREIRLPASVAASLRDHLAAQPDHDSTALAFPSEAGGPFDPGNLRRRVLKPLAADAGAPWAGFHTFRHTFASLHLAQGTNLLQLSRALGHHSPAFTLTRYTHLLPGDEAPALDPPAACCNRTLMAGLCQFSHPQEAR